MQDEALTRMTAADLHALSTAPPTAPGAPAGAGGGEPVPQWSAASADG
jgi:hypothetical protein